MNDIQSLFRKVIQMNKREAIVQAAIEVFTEKGMEKTKIADIVKRAGIAQGTFYLYFPTKLSVMPAIAEIMVQKIHDEIKLQVHETDAFHKQIEQLVQAVFTITEKYQTIQALVYAGLASTAHIRNWESIYEPLYKWIDAFLQEASTRGDIGPIHEETAKLVIALIESSAEQAFLYDKVDQNIAKCKRQAVAPFLIQALGTSD